MRRHRLANALQSALLLAGMAALFGTLGWSLLGFEAMMWAAAAALVMFAAAPRVSPALVLRLYRARPIDPGEAPELYWLLRELALRAELPAAPRLHYVPSMLLNAFTVGHPAAAHIALTDGLLRGLTLRELAGVLAHEVSHIQARDIWIMGLADAVSRLTLAMSLIGQLLFLFLLPFWLAGAVEMPVLTLLALVLAPLVSSMLQMALARVREYDADANAARLTGDPRGLASALAKLERVHGSWIARILAPGRREPEPALLRTHPPTEERIRRLLEIEREERPAFSAPYEDISFIRGLPLVVRRPRWHPASGLWF